MTETGFYDRYGPWAFVAGASMGIGAAFSHAAASRGLNVVMVARGRELLEAKAAEVAEQHGVETRTLAADLADPEIGAVVSAAVDGLDVGLFVYNAAVAPHGLFLETDMELQQLSVDVNCRTAIVLCDLFGRRFVDRGRGGIGMVTSLAAVSGAIRFGTYNAGKAFQWILAESLWAELGDHGVDVSTIFVGATASPNFQAFQETLDPSLCERGDTDDPLDRARYRLMHPATPEQVAEALYGHLGHGPVCFPSDDEAWIAERCLAMPRQDSIAMWRALQETSLRTTDRMAR